MYIKGKADVRPYIRQITDITVDAVRKWIVARPTDIKWLRCSDDDKQCIWLH